MTAAVMIASAEWGVRFRGVVRGFVEAMVTAAVMIASAEWGVRAGAPGAGLVRRGRGLGVAGG